MMLVICGKGDASFRTPRRLRHGLDHHGAIACAPRHSLSEQPSASVELIKRPCVGRCAHGPLDEKRIRELILAGVAAADGKAGMKLSVAQAFYVEDDSRRYDLFEKWAFFLASKRLKPAE